MTPRIMHCVLDTCMSKHAMYMAIVMHDFYIKPVHMHTHACMNTVQFDFLYTFHASSFHPIFNQLFKEPYIAVARITLSRNSCCTCCSHKDQSE